MLSGQSSHAQNGFYNPLWGHRADPFITYQNGSYYFMSTNPQNLLTVTASSSIQGLPYANEVNVYNSGPLEAPDLSYFSDQGHWYIYYTSTSAGTSNQSYVIESDGGDAQGTYHYKGQICSGCWDLSVFTWIDGSRYVMYTNGGGSLMISALSDPWTPSGNAVAIAQRTQSWENSPQGCCIENPWAVIHNGQLSVLYAANWYASTGYAEGLLKFNGGNLLDPNSWTKVAGPVFGGSNSSSPGYGAGTAALFSSPDGTETWFAYHAWPENYFSGDARDIRVQRVSWNSDNTPNLGSIDPITKLEPLPSGDPGGSFGPQNAQTFRIANVSSGKCIDQLGSTSTFAPIGQWDCRSSGDPNQQWRLSDQGSRFFGLTSLTSGQCIDDPGGMTASSTKLQQYPCNNLSPQSWRFTPLGYGQYKLYNQAGGLIFDDPGGSTNNGETQQLYHDVGAPPQQWTLQQQQPY